MENLTKESSRKLLEFVELTLKGSQQGASTTTESSEDTETCETSETSEDSENSESKEGSESGSSESSENSEDSEKTETSETSESSEKTEDSEMKFFLEKIVAINPAPDEWGPLVSAIETVMATRIARG
jgi:hypothetical protein